MKWKLYFKSVVEIPTAPCSPAHQLIGLIHAEETKTASSWLGIFYIDDWGLNQICNRKCILSAEFSCWLHSKFPTTKQWIWSQRADPDKCCRRVRNWSTCPKQQSKELNLANGQLYLQGAQAFHPCCSRKLMPAAPEIRPCRSRCSTVATPFCLVFYVCGTFTVFISHFQHDFTALSHISFWFHKPHIMQTGHALRCVGFNSLLSNFPLSWFH